MGHRNLPLPDAQPCPCTQAAAVFLLAQFPVRFLIYKLMTEQHHSAPVLRARNYKVPRSVFQSPCDIFWGVQDQGVMAHHGPGRDQAQSQGGPTLPFTEVPRHVTTITKELSQLPSHVSCARSETSPPWMLTPPPVHH